MKILDTYWFTHGGIVKAENSDGEVEYFIRGLTHSFSAEFDAQFILDWGATFPKLAGDSLFK